MKWTILQGGEIGAALSGPGAAARVELIARVDLAAPRNSSALCTLVVRATDVPVWEGAAPADGRARVILRGTKAASVTLVAAGSEALHAALTPGGEPRVTLDGPALHGDERLLVAIGRDALRVWQLPGLAPRARVSFPDGSAGAVELDAIAIDVDLDRQRLSMFWRGSIAVPRGVKLCSIDDVAIEGRVAPAASVALPAMDLRPLLPSPACATPIDDDSGLVAITFPWRLRPPNAARVVVVKGTFDMVVGGHAVRAGDQDALAGEAGGEQPYPGDFAPHKPRADVLLRGHAHAKPGATTAYVELSVGALSVKVAAIGPRRWRADGRPSEPLPFDRVALSWENAFGGPGSAANPVGAGLAPDPRVPQLERPGELIRTRADRPSPAGFSPIPRAWEARARKTGSYDAAWLSARWPHFPKDFDWTHECAAPEELTVEALRGDEAYRITSVLPGGGDLVGSLPGVRLRAFAEHAGGAVTEVPLRLDTALFDADRRKVVLVWRGALELVDEAAPQRFLIVDEPIDATRSMDEIRRRLAARRGPEAPAQPSAPALMAEIRATLAERRPLPGAASAHAMKGSFARAARPAAPRVTRREVERWLSAGERLAGRDMSGADLSGIDLSGRDLSGALLRGTILDDATLDGAICDGILAVDLRARRSSWKGARLIRANFARAELGLADLSGAVIIQASFADAELEGLVARRADGTSAQLVRARMPGASFEEAKLGHADLSGAMLEDACFTGASLDDAKLYEVLGEGMSADRASLADARFEAARLARASFRGARAKGSMWEGAELAGADFTDAELEGAGFTGAGLTRARFGGANLTGAQLRLTALTGASFARADLMRADLSGAAAAGADFSGANLYQAETGPGRLAGAKIAGAFVKGTKLA